MSSSTLGKNVESGRVTTYSVVNIRIVSVKLGIPIVGRVKTHPRYEIIVHDQDSDREWKVAYRFTSFRDQLFHHFEQYKDTLPEIMNNFPKTFHKSALGFQLDPRELEERRRQLENWLIEVVDKNNQLSEDLRHALFQFLHVEQHLHHKNFITSGITENTKESESFDGQINELEVAPTLIGTLDTIQGSNFWTSYRESQIYNVSIHVYEATLNVEGGFKFALDENDVYALIYLTRDKDGTKQRTSFQKKSDKPVWNESLVFEGLSFDDRFKVEIKVSKSIGTNRVLLEGEFVVDDAMDLSQQPYVPFRMSTDKLTGTIQLGFDFDPQILITGQQTNTAIQQFPNFDFGSSSSIQHLNSFRNSKRKKVPRVTEILKISDPVYYSIDSSFACFMMDADYVGY